LSCKMIRRKESAQGVSNRRGKRGSQGVKCYKERPPDLVPSLVPHGEPHKFLEITNYGGRGGTCSQYSYEGIVDRKMSTHVL